MIERQSWFREFYRVVFILLVSGLLGWAVGYTLLALELALLTIVGFWFYQLWRMQKWLSETDEEPPEAFGVWGLIYDRIYLLQRKNREARGRLQSALDYMQDSMASMRDGVVMVDSDGSIEWCNGAAGRLLGLQYPEDRGQLVLNLVRLPEFLAYFSEDDFSEPLNVIVGGDTELHLQFEVTRFGDGNRLLFVRDITSKVRLENMRRDFVGNVSHELRTPLTVIKGYLETMLSSVDRVDPKFQRALLQMDQQAVRMETLLKDLLWLSRIESLDKKMDTESIDMSGLLEELEDELCTNYPDRKLVFDLERGLRVQGSYRELHSAISNLVLNAIKYSDERDEVLVRWRRVGEESLLEVQDRGIGIDSIHLPRLTERFYRVDESRSSTTGGTGLGLAIVKHVAAAHGAELRIDSQLGEGSTFTLAFRN